MNVRLVVVALNPGQRTFLVSKKTNKLKFRIVCLEKIHDNLEKRIYDLNVKIARLERERLKCPDFPGHVRIEMGKSLGMRGERIVIQFAVDEYLYRTFRSEPMLIRRTVQQHCLQIVRELEEAILKHAESQWAKP